MRDFLDIEPYPIEARKLPRKEKIKSDFYISLSFMSGQTWLCVDNPRSFKGHIQDNKWVKLVAFSPLIPCSQRDVIDEFYGDWTVEEFIGIIRDLWKRSY